MPKIVNKSEKREKLVQAAIPVFAKHGFRETKMSDIAIKADVGKGTLYEYFDSKDELFLNTFKVWFSYFTEQMQDIVSREKNPHKQLLVFFQQLFATIEQYGVTYFIFFDFWSELTRNPLLNKQEIVNVYQSLRELFSSALEEGVELKVFKPIDCMAAGATLLAISDGLLVQWLIDESAFSIEEVGVSSIKSYLDSIIYTP